MKNNKKKILFLVLIVFFNVSLISCAKEEKNRNNEKEKNSITINKGAYLSLEDGIENLYNLNSDNIYEKINTDEIIIQYNKDSGNYIYSKDSKFFVKYNDEDIILDDNGIESLNLSADGQFLFYFINNGMLQPVVIDLKENVKINIGNKATISGHYIDWIENNKLVYYGIEKENKKSGIFTYDIDTNEEELIYEISKGYISFLKALNNEIIFVQDNMEDKKYLISINKDKEHKIIVDNMVDIRDAIIVNETIYVLGKVKNGAYSIYEVLDDSLHRVVYDFPTMINLDKKMSLNENGELLFMGSNDDYNIQNIYSYKDGNVKLQSTTSGKYDFIDIN